MPQHLSHENRLRVVRLLLNKWRAKDIGKEVGCNTSTVYHIKENLLKYGSTYKPQLNTKGRPTKIPESAKEAIEAFLREHPEAQQKDIRLFLFKEYGVEVHKSSISRLLRGDCQNGKKGILSDRSPQKSKPQAVQPSPDRPLCGQPHCSQYPSAHSPPRQPQFDQHIFSQDQPALPQSTQFLSGQQLPGQRQPSQLPPNHIPPGQRPSNPTAAGQR